MCPPLFVLLHLLPLAFCRPSLWEINLRRNSTFNGDMVLTPRQLARYENSANPVKHVFRKENSINRWTNNVVPYVLSPQYSSSQATLLENSIQALQGFSCFRFMKRNAEKDYLFIAPLDGCYSYVGKIGGRQVMSLAVDCLADYIIWHEMMHALGHEHEQSRPDRDNYIRVVYQNVQPGLLVNFEKLLPSEVDYADPYDYKSIMHYDGYAFGRIEGGRRLATMIPLKAGVVLEDNMKLSKTDIAKLNRLGKCGGNKQVLVEGECKDQPMVNCWKMTVQCRSEQYRHLMDAMCPRTCGRCAQRETCSDLDGRCPIFASNGFCTNLAYRDEPRIRCPKSCGFC